MPLPSFTIAGTLFDLLGNTSAGEIVGNGLGGATPATVTFTSNVPAGYFVTFDGAAYRVDEVTAEINSDGTITRNGEVVLLLANDDGLSVDGVQWQVHITGMKRFWFNAPTDGGTVDLDAVVPVPGIGVSGVAFSAGELVTLLANSGSTVREALDAYYVKVSDTRYDLTTFGALGMADDTAVVQDALDTINSASGGVLHCPEGTFIVDGLVYHSDVTIDGAGTGATVIKAKAGSTDDVLSSYNFASLTGTTAGGGTKQVRIRNLSIDGNKAQCPSGGNGISIFGPGFQFENVDVYDCHGHGYVLDYGDSTGGFVIPLESHMVDCRAYRGEADGFHTLGAHDSYARGCLAAGNAGVGIKAGGFAWNWTDCHSWGEQEYAWQLSGINFLMNCHGEGGTVAQFFVDWHEVTIIGGSCFAPGDADAKGLDFAEWLPERTMVKGMRFFGFGSGSGPAMDLTNLGPQSHIEATIDQATGTAIAGSPPGDAYVNVQVGGGTTTPNLVQIPGFYNPPTNPPAVVDSFTAADGSAPDTTKWTKTVGSGAAAAVNIQGNALQLKCGADGGYSSDDFVSLASTLGATLVDGELLFRLTSSSVTVESYLLAGLRSADADPLAGANAYILKISQNTNSTWQVVVMKRVSSSNTTLVNLPVAAVINGQKTWFRFRVEGTKITLRKWADGTAEPIVPTWSGTDSSIAGGGLATFALNGGAAAANGIQKIDNIAIYAL